jgi:hypothetical protein
MHRRRTSRLTSKLYQSGFAAERLPLGLYRSPTTGGRVRANSSGGNYGPSQPPGAAQSSLAADLRVSEGHHRLSWVLARGELRWLPVARCQ